jgi:hypothetical protein
MSAAHGMIEHMFEGLAGGELLDVARDATRAERSAIARRLIAVGRFCQQRLARITGEHDYWCVDDWEAIAAEVGAELCISRGRASSQMHYGMTLIERLPRLAEVFLGGDVDFAVFANIDYRTGLITDKDVLAKIDAVLASKAPHWTTFSREKVTQLVDWMVVDADPDAVRVARQRDVDRHIEVEPGQHGLADVYGSVRATDATAFDKKLDALAATVCPEDPRTTRQRRADALGAMVAGAATMACICGSQACPAATAARSAGEVVIHVLAEAATVDGASAKPGYLPGYGALPAAAVQQLAKRAKVRPVAHPNDIAPEPRYRPSAAMAELVRCRDLTCRFPGCDQPAQVCDIDHTVPYPIGPTHPSNLKLYCKTHHLLKTFYCGPDGWNERQLPDGTVIWTSPSGRTYTTKPGGALFFPQLAIPTGKLILPVTAATPSPNRGLAMPTRRCTRKEERAYRIEWERGINRARYAANPPPY